MILSIIIDTSLSGARGFGKRFVKNLRDMYKLDKLSGMQPDHEDSISACPLTEAYSLTNELELDLNRIDNFYSPFSLAISIIVISMLLGFLIVHMTRIFYIYHDSKYWSGATEIFMLMFTPPIILRLVTTAFFKQRYKAAVVTALRSFVQKMMNLSYASEVDAANLLTNAVVKATLPNRDMYWIFITVEELVDVAREKKLTAKAAVRMAINVAQPEHKVQVAMAVVSGIIKVMSINGKNSLIREVIFSATELLRSNNIPMLYGMFVAKKVLPKITKASPKYHKTGLEKIRIEASVLIPLLENKIRRTTLMTLVGRKITLEEETTEAALQAAKIQANARGTQSIETSKLLDIMAEAAAMAYNETIAEEMLCVVIKTVSVPHKTRIAQASIEVVLLNTAENVRASAASKAILAAALVAPTKQRPELALKMAESAVNVAIKLALKEAKAEIAAKCTVLSSIIPKYSWLIDDIVRAVYGAAFNIESASFSARAATSKLITGPFPTLFNLFPNSSIINREHLEAYKEPKPIQLKMFRAVLIKERADAATRKLRQLIMDSQITIQSTAFVAAQSIVTAEGLDELKFETISDISQSTRSPVTFASEDIVSFDTLNIQASSDVCSEKTESVEIVSHGASIYHA